MNDLLEGGWWEPWQSWATLISLTIGYMWKYPDRGTAPFYFAWVTLIVSKHYGFSISEQCVWRLGVWQQPGVPSRDHAPQDGLDQGPVGTSRNPSMPLEN